MVTDQYDAFLDPTQWPGSDEQAALISIYGWTDVDFPAKGAVREAS
jgi:hypothetical protein